MTLRFIAGVVVALALAGQSWAATEYAVGQVWSYKTRPHDQGSKLKIWQIENHPLLGHIYHLSISGVRIGGYDAPNTIGHLPVSRETLDQSVIAQTTDDPSLPDPTPGIQEWRNAKGGVFTIPVADIVGAIDRTMPRPVP